MTVQLIVIGAGGHGREVLDVVEASNSWPDGTRYDLLGVVDDNPTAVNLRRLDARGVLYLGDLHSWVRDADRDVQYVIGIGSCAGRRAVDERLSSAGFVAATLVHPSAVIGSRVRLAPGVVVCSGVVMTTNITVGRHSHLNFGAAVGHDVTIGDYVMVNPSTNISGECLIEDEVMLGVNSTVLQGLIVRRGAIVGASACVVTDVPEEQVAKGVPARWTGQPSLTGVPGQRAGRLAAAPGRAQDAAVDFVVSGPAAEEAI